MNQDIEIAERLKMHQFQGIVRLALFKIFRQTEMLQIFLVAIEEIVLRKQAGNRKRDGGLLKFSLCQQRKFIPDMIVLQHAEEEDALLFCKRKNFPLLRLRYVANCQKCRQKFGRCRIDRRCRQKISTVPGGFAVCRQKGIQFILRRFSINVHQGLRFLQQIICTLPVIGQITLSP